MSILQFKEFIKKYKWVFAKTYAKTFPHEYILKDKDNSKEFKQVVKYIRDNGVEKPFFKKKYIYLEVDGYKYWTMGSPIEATIVLNRVII